MVIPKYVQNYYFNLAGSGFFKTWISPFILIDSVLVALG